MTERLTMPPPAKMETVDLMLSPTVVTDRKIDNRTDRGSNSTGSLSPPSAAIITSSVAPAPYTPASVEAAAAAAAAEAAIAAEAKQAELDALTHERNQVLDTWADAKSLGLTTEEIKINMFLKSSLRYLFGQTGFDPPVPARNPVSVSMHNPRFAVALWALNTEAYRRRGKVSSLLFLVCICL